MFTGLVQDCGRIVDRRRVDGGWEICVETRLPKDHLKVGASIAVDGVCLTVTECSFADLSQVRFFLGPVTLKKSTFEARLSEEEETFLVNLEPALRQGDPLGGHLVLGHVDRLAQVSAFARKGDSFELRLKFQPEDLRYLVREGSVAVRGISLTIAEVEFAAHEILIMVIPHTYKVTNLRELKLGDLVEVEVDSHVKTIVQCVERMLPAVVQKLNSGSPIF